MEKGEPALVPEWLRNTTTPGASSSSVHTPSSSPHHDANGSPSGFPKIITNNGFYKDSPWTGNRFQTSDNGFQGLGQSTPPSSSVQNQRLEDIAIRQSRQLVPMTPSKSSGSSHCDKQKLRATARVLETSFGSKNAHSPPANGRSKISNPHFGNLQVLKPVWEYNPTTTAAATSAATMGGPANDIVSAHGRRVPSAPERRAVPPPAQSRNDFFELVRRKSVTTGGISESESESFKNLPGDSSVGPTLSLTVGPTVGGGEEEELLFLRSLGWEEKGVDEKEEDWALTHDEINGFFQRCVREEAEKKLSERVLLKVRKLPGCPSSLLHGVKVEV